MSATKGLAPDGTQEFLVSQPTSLHSAATHPTAADVNPTAINLERGSRLISPRTGHPRELGEHRYHRCRRCEEAEVEVSEQLP